MWASGKWQRWLRVINSGLEEWVKESLGGASGRHAVFKERKETAERLGAAPERRESGGRLPALIGRLPQP